MSRPDSHDFEYPPGLGYLRNGASGAVNGDEGRGGSYPGVDRRTSMPFGGYPLYQAAAAGAGRSLTSPAEWDQTDAAAAAPNRHNPPQSSAFASSPGLHPNHHNHHHSHSHFAPSPFADNPAFFRPPLSSPPALSHSPPSATHVTAPTTPSATSSINNNNNNNIRATLWWGDLEPWMDEEYAKQVCNLMSWDPSTIKVPHPPPDPASGQQANNPGYAYLTFPTPSHAAAVLAQVSNASSSLTMPNSSKPFSLNWASNVQPAAASHQPQQHQQQQTAQPVYPQIPPPHQPQQSSYQKEYSIFVGDLAPETSNSDLVAVFRNPVLGLRNDREPKFIRPFLSCKSAKIMLDPVTGVSRGYGFVRFTDERDQQRALIEMHGLYCLSRPMRISPATAKYKPPNGHDMPQLPYPQYAQDHVNQPSHSSASTQPNVNKNLPPSVSAPIAATGSTQSLNSVSPSSGSSNNNLMSAGSSSNSSIPSPFTPSSSDELMNLPTNVLAQIAQQYATSGDNSSAKHTPAAVPSITAQFAQERNQQNPNLPPYMLSEESWKHHAQARAILGNLIGPNGEQLTSTDPYNTTVFVGGLSPLISEDTLRTFFAPFGDIHYVKVPVGKHCGFVQFVRKADAERAIEKMQGFPVGGSRIRLSWGRSQYKAAQAAAQAAQQAALQQFPSASGAAPVPPNVTSPPPGLTQQQAIELLQRFAAQGYLNPTSASLSGSSPGASQTAQLGAPTASPMQSSSPSEAAPPPPSATVPHYAGLYGDDKLRAALLTSRHETAAAASAAATGGQQQQQHLQSQGTQSQLQQQQQRFSPFSPDPNMFFSSGPSVSQTTPRGNGNGAESLPHPSKAYASGFFPGDEKAKSGGGSGSHNGSGIPSASTSPPSSHTSVTGFGDEGAAAAAAAASKVGRHPPISRPSSGQPRIEVADSMHDLNGTLAGLDLGHNKPWKSPVDSESSGSVQFRMTPSP